MVDEGRPCPDPELVQRVANILYARQRPDGLPVCPLMDSSDVLELSIEVPRVGLDEGFADFYTRGLNTVPGLSRAHDRHGLTSEAELVERFVSSDFECDTEVWDRGEWIFS